ncbi:diguanylate cyclase [Clostridium sp. C2-6-12]|uniref:diguanylate cyclase domain-containing protein n=1 Tax=Clostridium sp. C2-6-12 TaxID=2698832 RepID=UPI00136FC9B2|nr:diguanylate cyclase [Clostridium sp. C2-6-12]
MVNIPGYQINSKIYEGNKTIIYNGIRLNDGVSVLLKFLYAEYPDLNDIDKVKKQYILNQQIQSKNIVKIYNIEYYEKTPVLILEYFDGVSLNNILNTFEKMKPMDFLKIAIELSQGLIDIHYNNIIHKTIIPSHIIVNKKNNIVKFTGFENSTLFSNKINILDKITDLESIIGYISPEQTGRMNSSIDYRTDFYSLGVVFYEMLTGSLPFDAEDNLGMIHCHLAVHPISPFEKDPNIPQVISNIIMKLMEKMPDNRYQSAVSLKWDLEKCKNLLEGTGSITNFKIAERDISDVFEIPDKLYGREQEIKLLKSAFKQINITQKETILISGYSGVGKSELVNKFKTSIKNKPSYFISGKFDQFYHDIPSALIYSFSDLINQILSENKEQIKNWRNKLLNSLGSNGQVIIDVVPQVEKLIGKQKQALELSPQETKNRFYKVFKDFVKTFCESDHPLVIFWDDLQWADLSSLKLMETLISDFEIKNILFIGAYRYNEVDELHPLRLTINNIQNNNVLVNTIFLKPLKAVYIQQFISETFHCNINEVISLSEITMKKTDGNPFFMKQFLYLLYIEHLIWFNKKEWKWEWNLSEIKKVNIAENVVELITSRISKFHKTTVEILKLAACIGSQFDFNLLSVLSKIIYKYTNDDLQAAMYEALKEGIILPALKDNINNETGKLIHDNYIFLHDRIQQAIYSLIDEHQKQEIHLKIGKHMLANEDWLKQEGTILDIVSQLNLGIELIHNASEIFQIAELELLAGKFAKKSTAYDTAYKYTLIGIKLIEPFGWQTSYELIHSLYVQAAEIACLNGDYEAVEKYTQVALINSQNDLDKIELYEIKIIAYTAQNKKSEVLDTAIYVLKLLGMNFPKMPTTAHVLYSFIKTKLMLFRNPPENLVELPQMTNLFLCAALRIMVKMGMSTYMLNPNLFLLITLKAVRLYVKHGNLSSSPIGYAAYGMLLCSIGDIDSGYKFSQLALQLLDKFDEKEYKAQTYVLINCFINPWRKDINSTLNKYVNAYNVGLETGNINYACTAACLYGISSYYSGKNLANLDVEMSDFSKIMNKLKNKEALITQSIFQQAINNLIGDSENTYKLKGKVYNEDEMILIHQEAKDIGTLCSVYLNKSILSYLFGKYDDAFDNSQIAQSYLEGVKGTLSFAIFYFYNSLIMLACINTQNSLLGKQQIMHKISSNEKRLKKWAQDAPNNFLNKLYLVKAEKARILGQTSKAIDYYEKAIKIASENNYIQEEALSNELAAKYYLSLENKRIAKMYFEQSIYCYNLWGAKAKSNNIIQSYSNIFSFDKLNNSFIKDRSTALDNSISNPIGLDIASIVKATHAISGEIKLEELLKKLLYILLENAGAQRICYLIKREEKYIILAEGNIREKQIDVMKEEDFEATKALPKKIIYYVIHSKDTIILDSSSISEKFITDPYILNKNPKSIMCMPVLNKGNLIGILYLENTLIDGAFNNERIEIIKIISSQLAISLENAILYNDLERSEKQLREHHNKLEELIEQRTSKLKKEINERKKAEKLLEEMASHDYLTGLANRKLFQSELNYSLDFAKANDLSLAILFIDLDGFKAINDAYGHNCGDTVIKTIAARLIKIVKPSDVVSRFGGDEFVIIIKNILSIDFINEICNKIINEISLPIDLGNYKGLVTASIGISVYPTDGITINQLVKKADNAMYEAKKSGKNKFVFSK